MYDIDKLDIYDKISFILADDLLYGEIVEKNYLESGFIGFLIKLDNNKMLFLKSNNLDFYSKYE